MKKESSIPGVELPTHIKYYEIETHSDAWHEHRRGYLGGSDVGTAMGINKWNSRARLWQEKAGIIEPERFSNEPIFWGTNMEPILGETWKYYDIETDTYIENFNAGRKIRENINPNGFIVNENYPWLSMALDRIIPVGEVIHGGERLTKPAPLEIKTIDFYAHQANESGLPPYYETQILAQMTCLEAEYAEFAYLVGGIRFVVEPRVFHKSFSEQILEITHDFWYNHVVPAREIQAEIVASPKRAGMLKAKLVEFEPPVEDTERYKDWLKTGFVEEVEKMAGDDELWPHLITHKNADAFIKELEKISLYAKNHILKAHKDFGVKEINFNGGKSVYGKQHRVTVNSEYIAEKEDILDILKGYFK